MSRSPSTFAGNRLVWSTSELLLPCGQLVSISCAGFNIECVEEEGATQTWLNICRDFSNRFDQLPDFAEWIFLREDCQAWQEIIQHETQLKTHRQQQLKWYNFTQEVQGDIFGDLED